MPAPRQHRLRRNWPTGLYVTESRGKTYYRYLDPESGRFRGLGSDFEIAKQAALARNAELAKAPLQRYADKLAGRGSTVTLRKACDAFLDVLRSRRTGRGDDVRERSQATVDSYTAYCTRFCDPTALDGDAQLDSVTLRQVSDYLDGYGEKLRARNLARGILVQIWDVAIAKGWTKENVPKQTLKLAHEVKRKRLTLAQYEAVTAKARKEGKAWFAAAADLALYCDQRRGDVASLPVSAWKDGCLRFEQEKTGNVVKVAAGPLLRAAIEACLAIPPANAKLIVRKPGRSNTVSKEMLTKTFQQLRDELIDAKHKAWKGFARDAAGRPTWHEIRSLGAHLAKEAGKDVKSLAGHGTEAMAELYQKGHAKLFEAESL